MRSPGNNNNCAAVVNNGNGSIEKDGWEVHRTYKREHPKNEYTGDYRDYYYYDANLVRPAIWVTVE